MKTVIPVIGMHRSGTSAVTRCISLHGVSLGTFPHGAKGGDNPTGYWENKPIRQLHDKIIGWQTTSLPDGYTDEQVADAAKILRDGFPSALSVWKDPRACLHYPLWKRAAAAADVLLRPALVDRPLLEIEASLFARNGKHMTRTIEAYLAGQSQWAEAQHVRVTLREMWNAPTYARIQTMLGVVFPTPLPAAMRGVRGFLQPSLVHQGPEVSCT